MVSLEAFSELLQVLYSAPLQQEQWQHFLDLLSKHTDSKSSVLLCANSRSALSISAASGGGVVDQAAYNQKYAARDPFRAPIVRCSCASVVQDEDLLPNQGLLQTDLYRNLLAPAGLRYTTHLPIAISIRRLECVTIVRSHDQGPMGDDCNRLLNLLLPHVQKALEIRYVLGVAQHRLAGAEAMVDASATATFLLTRQGRILHRNAAAECLLRQSNALTIRDGILTPSQSRFREQLRRLFHAAASPASHHWRATPAQALSLPRSAGSHPLQLLASPLPPVHRSRSDADLVLLVTDPEKPVAFPDSVLRALYRLTPAQTDVANGMLTGYSLDDIAFLRKVSVGTVRQQVKSILSKTGTTRQIDLIRLLITLPQSAAAK